MVVVSKGNSKVRICVDLTYISKAMTSTERRYAQI